MGKSLVVSRPDECCAALLYVTQSQQAGRRPTLEDFVTGLPFNHLLSSLCLGVASEKRAVDPS